MLITQYCHCVESPIGVSTDDPSGNTTESAACPDDSFCSSCTKRWEDHERCRSSCVCRPAESLHSGIEGENLIIDDRGDSNVVDVVGGMKRMTLDVVGNLSQVKAEALEKHDGCIDSGAPGSEYAFSESVEVGLVEARQVKSGLPIPGGSRSSPRPRLWRHAEVHIGRTQLAPKLFPAPEANEVVTPLSEQPQVGVEVEPFWVFWAIAPQPQPIVEVVVDMRAREINRLLRGQQRR